jgi:thiol:disulfide interchange protein
LIAANGVVMLKADWTHKEATEVNKLLDVLGSRQVPQLAIFSSRDPNHPVVFREMYTQQQLLEAIEKAGPSQTVPKASRPAISAR